MIHAIRRFLLPALGTLLGYSLAGGGDLASEFRSPPDSARPGVYWYFMDGNLSRDGMTRDLEAMKAAGIGHLVFLEVNVGVPRGPVDFLSDAWQDLYVHAVREAERLGIEITLGSGPGWTGSGGPWVKPAQSMQHLVAAKVEVQGPAKFEGKLPVAPPHRPFFGDVPPSMRAQWESFYQDVAVLAFPSPAAVANIADLDEKALVYRAPYSSQANVKPRLPAPADFPADPPNAAIPLSKVLDLTAKLRPDGSLDWQVPAGKWTVMRFVSRNNGASTRPAPAPGIGFECDKFDAAALDAHFEQYVGKLLKKVGTRQADRGWTMLHIDSWEMGAQNWTPRLREEFKKRRGYDPLPFYPAYLGQIVGSREITERFLWDLRQTGQDLVIQNHAQRLKTLGREHGFKLSIEPYDMNPTCDFDLGAVADVPMCEFWSVGFDTAYSCHTASSIAHVMGCPVVAAEAFTGAPGENWKFHPGYLKNQGDWAFCTGINRLTYHTFAHKPDEGKPGMVMGPYGVHWDRGQTWWPMVADYHRYISRCQHLLRQGRTVADVLYLLPEGAPNVFTPPASAFAGDASKPDRRGFNFDGCSAPILIEKAAVRDGCVVFPSGASYRLLVLPDAATMTPQLLEKLAALIEAGATVVGNPPRQSPSLVDFPACDAQVAKLVTTIWGTSFAPAGQVARRYGAGAVVAGEALYGPKSAGSPPILGAQWIWEPGGKPATVAPMGSAWFRREFQVPANRRVTSARLEMTADNSFIAILNGKRVLAGDNFHHIAACDVSSFLKVGANVLSVQAENGGDAPNPAGLIGALRLQFADRSEQLILTDDQWTASADQAGTASKPAQVLGAAAMSPWRLQAPTVTPPLYPEYDLTSQLLQNANMPEDFTSTGPLRFTHRRSDEREIYFVANRSGEAVKCNATFRVVSGDPEIWDPLNGSIRRLPEFTRENGVTEIPLQLEAFGSCFVVFPITKADAPGTASNAKNFPEFTELSQLAGPWEVAFDATMGAPAATRFDQLDDWTKRPEPGIRHYSGIAIYRTTFDLPKAAGGANKPLLFLDLGEFHVMARVRVNGTDCGIVWTAPRRVDISAAVRSGSNELEIEIANLWPNRMIGDAAAPERVFTQTTYRPYKATDPLLPSGLLGPVKILTSTTDANPRSAEAHDK